MQDLNKVIVIGRLTRDCGNDPNSFAYTQSGTCVAKVSIATNRSVKRGEQWEDEVSFFDVTIWGKTAENLKPYLLQGKQIAVEGYLKQDRWKDQQGNNHSRVGIVAETVQLVGGNQNGQASGAVQQNQNNGNGNFRPNVVPVQQNYPPQQNYQPQQPYQNNAYQNNGGMSGYEEDIPF